MALIALPSAALGPGPVGAAADDSIVVEDAGDPATAVTLPGAASVGETAASTTTLTVTVDLNGGGLDNSTRLDLQLDLTSSVTEVVAGEGYTARTRIDAIDVVEAPDGVDAATFGFDGLAGVEYDRRFDANGRVLATTLVGADQLAPAVLTAAEQFLSSLETGVFAFPAQSIGVGARWSVAVDLESEGLVVPVTYEFSLTDIANGRYTITLAFDSPFTTPMDGGSAAGRVSGAGTLTGSVDNPLDVSLTILQSTESSLTAGETTVTMQVAVGIVQETIG